MSVPAYPNRKELGKWRDSSESTESSVLKDTCLSDTVKDRVWISCPLDYLISREIGQ